jgi:prepilin-type N-terminal cleavage/methylation domain-containing protein
MPRGKRQSRAMTLVEILVAMAVAGAFLAGVFAAFIQIVKASDLAEAKLQAINNARAALELMSIDIKAARIDPSRSVQYFIGLHRSLAWGNGIDDDGDGLIDEEWANALDDDRDWNYATDDRHANIAGNYERSMFVGSADLGDAHVDEDCRFENDKLTFRIFPDPGNPQSRDDLITFYLGTYEGENHVLLRGITRNVSSGGRAEEPSPLAFNVVSLNFFYWDPNRTPNYWVTEWDSYQAATFPSPGIEIPVAVYMSVTVYAGTKPLKDIKPGEPMETIRLDTEVNIEQVLKDTRRRG